MIRDYKKLVKALRYCGKKYFTGDECKNCGLFGTGPLCSDKLKLDAAAAIETLQADLDEWTEKAFVNQSKALENLRRIPKSGRWIVEKEGENGINIYCSECGKNGQFPKWNFCPNCGAYMIGGEMDG